MKEIIQNKMKIKLNKYLSINSMTEFWAELEGEKIVKIQANSGFLHRGIEKMAQGKLFSQHLPVVEKIDYRAGFFYSQAYLSAAEELLEVEITKNAQYIRILTMELNRISSHLACLGHFINASGISVPVFDIFNLRNEILNIFENITGGRITHNYYVFGGVRNAVSNDNLNNIYNFVSNLNKKITLLDTAVTHNPIFIDKTKGLGVITTETALPYSITGVNLRASGYALDFRKEKPYLTYNELDFNIPAAFEGDCYSRYKLRIDEIQISVNLIKQCVDWLFSHTDGKINLDLDQMDIQPKTGRTVSWIESPRGLVMCHLMTNGSKKPERIKWRTPSFYAVQLFEKEAAGCSLSNISMLYNSLDIVLSEAER